MQARDVVRHRTATHPFVVMLLLAKGRRLNVAASPLSILGRQSPHRPDPPTNRPLRQLFSLKSQVSVASRTLVVSREGLPKKKVGPRGARREEILSLPLRRFFDPNAPQNLPRGRTAASGLPGVALVWRRLMGVPKTHAKSYQDITLTGAWLARRSLSNRQPSLTRLPSDSAISERIWPMQCIDVFQRVRRRWRARAADRALTKLLWEGHDVGRCVHAMGGPGRPTDRQGSMTYAATCRMCGLRGARAAHRCDAAYGFTNTFVHRAGPGTPQRQRKIPSIAELKKRLRESSLRTSADRASVSSVAAASDAPPGVSGPSPQVADRIIKALGSAVERLSLTVMHQSSPSKVREPHAPVQGTDATQGSKTSPSFLSPTPPSPPPPPPQLAPVPAPISEDPRAPVMRERRFVSGDWDGVPLRASGKGV